MLDPLEGLRPALADRYIIDREIGRGGSATVYLAQDLKHIRSVAIKLLAPELALAVRTERFLNEILFAARLQHPHILPLYDSGEANGLLYYVMPFVAGETLKDRLAREGRLALDEAVRIVREVADALNYAHEEGIIHRDIKPANILLSAGHAVVADFGIARAISKAGKEGVTDTNTTVGTPAYMSPEQAAGEKDLDGRTDIYSVGCVLYELLAGQPPFVGPGAQSLIAQHIADRAPRIRRSRGDASLRIERILERALAKRREDRFQTAGEMITALDSPDILPPPWWRRATTRAAMGAGAALLAVGVWRVALPLAQPLDPNKIVVFPLVERGAARPDEAGAGERVALMIGSALEHTEPLRWIDGWTWLGEPERGDITLLSAKGAREIARARDARYYIDGYVVRSTDSTTVILRLNEAGRDSLISQASASGPTTELSPAQLGLRGVTQLLPLVLEPGRRIDLSPLTERRPAAIASWLQGEREYRRSRFLSALGFYKRALNDDSALAVAALKGAQAASWENLDSEAMTLVRVALAHSRMLPSKHHSLAAGLSAYYHGQADSAVAFLSTALTQDPEWAEAHMAIGEVFYHLLPRTASPLDSLAQASFQEAFALDTGFAPPLYHLTEIAIRNGNLEEAARLLERFQRFAPDSARRRQLGLMYTCVKEKPGTTPWRAAGHVAPMDVLQAARALAVGGQQPRCAEEALRSVLAAPDLGAYHWGAFKTLNGLLVAEERFTELAPLMDSVIKTGMRSALALYFLDVFAGAPFDADAAATDSALSREHGEKFTGVSVQSRWLIASWRARHRDSAGVALLLASLLSDPAASAFPVSEALAGHAALGRGDTADAISHLEALELIAPRDALEWGLFEPLAVERFATAELALARGDFDDALRAAAVFDHPSPVAFLPFVALSLRIRLRAAQALHRSEEVTQYTERLQRLKHRSLLASTLN